MHTASADDDADIRTAGRDWVARRLSTPGGVTATQLVCRPDRLSRVLAAASAPEGRSLIARGGGQGHGDAALNDGGAVVLTTRLDRMLGFDASSGVLVVEAGVTVGDILRTFLPRGFALAACPGSSRTTVGGAIAADVHGLDHARAGSFGAHVVWLDVVTPRDGLLRVSPAEEAALFDATVGGMGLTGIIARAAIQLVPVTSAAIDMRHQAVGTLDSLVDQLAAAALSHAYASAWIEIGAGVPAQGRGVLMTADPPLAADGSRPPSWPTQALGALANRTAQLVPGRLHGAWRFRRAHGSGSQRRLPLGRFLFLAEDAPHDGRRRWLQCALPADGAVAAIRRLVDIARRGGGVANARLQAMGSEGRGMLSFARPGIGLTFELMPSAATADTMRRLERETLDRGGRLFLANDSHLTDHGFAAMYPRLAKMRAVLARFDPEFRMQSDLARRLRLRDYIV
ncbi:MAG TPA: FAD-binding oxidoreductase [Vineibacter sp.]|nr:FAD-binding oxidoreductase [Vineibacter sp.]